MIYPSLFMYEIEWFIRHFLCNEIEWFIRENWSWLVIFLIFLLRKVVAYPGGGTVQIVKIMLPDVLDYINICTTVYIAVSLGLALV